MGMIKQHIHEFENFNEMLNVLREYYRVRGSLTNIKATEAFKFHGKEVYVGAMVAKLRRMYKL